MLKSLFFFLSFFSSNLYLESKITETRVKICIIDTGIIYSKELYPYMCKGNDYDFTGKGIKDTFGHGTNIAWILKNYLDKDKQCIKVLKFYTWWNISNVDKVKACLNQSIKEECSYINMSFGGGGYDYEERLIIIKALKKKIILGIAAGNDRKELKYNCNYYPPCYKIKSDYLHIVGSGTSQHPDNFSNYGEIVTDWADGSNQCAGYDQYGYKICMHGTSQAVPNFLGNLIKKGK